MMESKLPVSYDDVTLRAMEPEDLELLYEVENDVSLWGVGVTNTPYSRSTLRQYIATATGDIYEDRQVRMMIDNRQGETVGIVDLMHFEPQHRRAEVGIVVFGQYRNCGYGLAALSHLFRYAHATLHLHKMYALVAADNAYSVRLFEAAGFTREGHLHDWLFDGDSYHDVFVFQRTIPVR